ncbi:hypothetical protein QMO17_31685, partial [Klebsiella pneumoniae]|nr:hypothetical protein [Klebsiella pneumoniae]
AYFGQLGQISVRLGAYVSAGTHLTSLVPPQHWVIANLKETQLAAGGGDNLGILQVDLRQLKRRFGAGHVGL